MLIPKPVGRMILVITVAWALILSESFLFFYIIRPTAPNIHLSLMSEAIKVSSVASLAILWVAVLYGLERFLFRPLAPSREPASS